MKYLITCVLSFIIYSSYSATIDVTAGPATGNTTVVITARAMETFGANPTVTIGAFQATIWDNSATEVEIRTPEGVGVNLEVTITSSNGTIIADNTFSYDAPVITNISPSSTRAAGGEIITVQGNNFGTPQLGVARVFVNGQQTEVTSHSQSEVQFRMIPGSGQSNEVRVRIASQQSNPGSIDYHPPSVWRVDPRRIDLMGGDTLFIRGANFGQGLEVPQVAIGGNLLSEVYYISDDLLYAITDQITSANINLNVGLDGQISLPYGMQTEKPLISSISQDDWSTSGGETITIFGSGFGYNIGAISVTIDGVSATITSQSSGSIQFLTPVGVGKQLPLVVSLYGVPSDTFVVNYADSQLLTMVPNTGPTIGFSYVTISGTGINADLNVPEIYFGDIPASNVAILAPNVLQCTTPAGVGMVDVQLKVNDFSSNPLSFTYDPPLLTGIIPIVYPFTGGTATLSGVGFGTDPDKVTILVDGNSISPNNITEFTCTFQMPPGYGINHSVAIIVDGQVSSSIPFFYLSPTIQSIHPTSGLPGDLLTITGTNLGGLNIKSQVNIGGNAAGILNATNTTITCVVPNGSGNNVPVNINVGGQTDTFNGFTYGTPPATIPKATVVGRLAVEDIPYQSSNSQLLTIDGQGNLLRSVAPQLRVSITNDTLFLGSEQFIIVPGISAANGGQ